MYRKNLFFGVLAVLGLVSCTENIDMSNRYTFKDETVMSYLEKHEDYSEYVALLNKVPISAYSKSTVGQLMAARGHFTCFAPTNEAIHNYLGTLVEEGLITEPSWDAFTDAHKLDSICNVVVKNSIIDGEDGVEYETGSFPLESGEFELSNMNDRKISVHYGEDAFDIYINGDLPISRKNRDIPCINGVIHQMEAVIAPSDNSIAELLRDCLDGKHDDFKMMAKLLFACGLQDTLSKKRDEEYERLYLTGAITDYEANGLQSTADGKCYVPQHRKYGFTLFAEHDDLWREIFGKDIDAISVDEFKNWVVDKGYYPDAKNDNNYTDPDNVLNQFVTYHLLPMRIPNNKLVLHNNEKGFKVTMGQAYTIPVMEHYTTMGKPRLLKIYQSYETNRAQPVGSSGSGIFLNRFPILDNGRTGTYHEIGCDPDKEGVYVFDNAPNLNEYNTINGMVYPIDKVLAYTNDVQTNLMKTRIRFEGMSLFPEAMTNDIRQNSVGSARTQCVAFPQDSKYRYLENLSINDNTKTFAYFCAWNWNWNNYQGDEIKGVGQYDYTFKLPPVPKRGTYEVRYKVLANIDRGVCQVYFGSDPNNLPIAGIPMDLTIGGVTHYSTAGNRPSIAGWVSDSDDPDGNAEIDKNMRINGFMKGPEYYWDGSITSRQQDWNVRRIVVRQTLDPDKQYYLRFKSCIESMQKEFYMDYIEYCAKEVYDNPVEPEDIW